MNNKRKTGFFGFAIVAALALYSPAGFAEELPNLKAYLGLRNINITFFKMNEGRQYLKIGFAKWHSTKPVKVESWNEYTLLHKIPQDDTGGSTWRGFQIDHNKKTAQLKERIMDLTITKRNDQYIGTLFVNGEDWSGWAGHFELEPANQ